MEKKGPDYHSMQRRMETHNYSLPGIYHITLHVAEGMGQPLGQVEGSLEQPDGTPSGPHVTLTPIGQMLHEELLSSISEHYPMVIVDTFTIMPEHMHVLLQVTTPIVSSKGRPTHLGQVIAGYKKGCNRRYWAMTGQDMPAGEPLNTLNAHSGASAPSGSSGVRVPSGSPAGDGKRVPSDGTTGRPPLFAYGYCDVQPITAEQLETQRAYIKANPRSRLLRTSQRATLMPCRSALVKALTPAALRKYLLSVCLPQHATPEALAAIECRLLLTACAPSASPASRVPSASPASRVPSASTAFRVPSGSPASRVPSASTASRVPSVSPASRVPSGSPAGICSPAGNTSPFVTLDSYGDRSLLERRLLPVVCHYKEKACFSQQKARCLEEAAQGAVLVSARIAKGEQEIMNEVVNHGFPVIIIADNGFPERYHPSTERIDRCAEGKLLLVTPWQYQYRGKNEQLTIPFCKAMNCVAQALCRQKDDWWKAPAARMSCGSPAPMVSSGSPAPMVSSGSPAPMVSSGSPAPMVSSGSPAPMVSCGSPAPMVSSGSPAENNDNKVTDE